MKSILIAILLLFSGLGQILLAQNDPTKEILVYFKSGVERTQKDLPAQVKSVAIRGILTRLKYRRGQNNFCFSRFK
jgi:hypothetical protein